MPLKNLISSPLEAGQSVLDAHRLPPTLEAALEYTARRLARKALSIDLVVVRREYQLPRVVIDASSSSSQKPDDVPAPPNANAKPLPPLPNTPPVASASAPTGAASRFASALRVLVRSNTANTAPGLASATSSSTSSSGSRWPFSPSSLFFSLSSPSSTTYPSTPSTPATPATPNTVASADSFTTTTTTTTTTTSSSLYSQCSTNACANGKPPRPSVSRATSTSTATASLSLSPTSFGLRLVHADSLPRSHKRVLASALAKAAQRFAVPPNWLPPPVPASALGLPASLVDRSLAQNQILFQGQNQGRSGSSSLVLRSLDHLYTFKAALCSYAQTGHRYRLEDAVDELRRYILLHLGGGGAAAPTTPGARRPPSLAKRELLRQYPELSCFSDAHIVDVNRMYSRAYGGPEHECGIEADGLSLSPPGGLLSTVVPDTAAATTDDEQSTPIATTMDDSALESSLCRSTRSTLQSLQQSGETSPVPILGTTRQRMRRRPTGMIFARPAAAGDDTLLAVVDNAPPTASSLTSSSSSLSSLSPALSTPSSLPSLCLSMSSAVSQLWEEDELVEEEEEEEEVDQNPKTDYKEPELQAEDVVSPVDVEVAFAQAMSVTAVTIPPRALPLPAPPSTTIVLRPAARSFLPLPLSPTARLPVLKLQTTFERSRDKVKKPAAVDRIIEEEEEEEEEEEQLTARPVSCVRRTFLFGGGGGGLGSSIGEVLGDFSNSTGKKRRSADTVLTLASPLSGCGDDPVSAGPVPPRSYDDISPITRSEWGFLKGDLMGRQVTVTTF